MQNYKRLITVGVLAFPSALAFANPMAATLNLKERVSMEELARNVLDPNSDRFERYYTPEEIRELSAPSDSEYKSLTDTLKSKGFTIVYESKTHLLISIQADHTNFEQFFKTSLQFSGNSLHMYSVPAQIPPELSLVQSITGLDNSVQFKPNYKIYENFTETAQQPGILPNKIKAAYGMTELYRQGLTGRDQHIAIATYMNFAVDDVREYYQKIELAPIPELDVIYVNGKVPYDPDSASETELDAEFSGMMAPGANIHVFAVSENSEAGELALFTSILDDNRSKLVSYSWGICEAKVSKEEKTNMDKVFSRSIAQGVNILAASGDTGSDSCEDGSRIAHWPALHPNLIAVGGTSVHLNKDGSKREIGWSGSGGGVSNLYQLPSWQATFKPPFSRRSFPDVSFNADPATGEAIWIRQRADSAPFWAQVGGTSMAVPQWVGFLALVNEERTAKGQQTLGFLNPILYNASNQDKERIFNDITEGKNGAYTAGKGWDAVTGWGTMRGIEMFNYLVSH